MIKPLVLIGFLLMYAGCASTPQCPPQPGWISSPEQEGYYVGVGSADSGNQAEDRPVAEARAKADLAARISVQITSDMAVATSSSSDGDYSQQVQELVNQSVEKNIEDIETVDTYYCRTMGSWVYVRLSKDRWEEIQEQRRSEILGRVKDLLDPVFLGTDSSITERLERLRRSYGLINASSLGQKIIGEVAGESGNISDIVISLLNRQVGDLQVRLERKNVSLEVGEPFSVDGFVSSSLPAKIGVLEMVVVDTGGRELLSTRTRDDGSFSIRIPGGFSSIGDRQLLVYPRLDAEAVALLENPVPVGEITLVVNKITAGFLVNLENAQVGRSVEKEVKALFFDRELPFEFVDRELPGGYNLQVSLFVEDFPKVMENAPLMAKAWAVVSILKEGKSLYSYESRSVKDGGIDLDQAHSRVLNKLIGELRADTQLFEKLKTNYDK